jgi:hypothetical protein
MHTCRGLIDCAVRQGLWVVAMPRLSQLFRRSTTAQIAVAMVSNGVVHVTQLRWISLLMENPRSLMCGGFHRRNGPTLTCGATRAAAMGEPHWTIFPRYLPEVTDMRHKTLRTHLALLHPPVMYHLQTRTHTRHHPHSRIRPRHTNPQLLLPLCQQSLQAS